ncbi:aldose epimerase family protein [Jiangella rhizosphaerae]|uniref:aldose epimerase family protein n=1 Tax=Jiangella rhizosphaerae TaxID=2293569 RepID=UPI001314166D|nr:hypothetical protein [Jiangella rhizosphaerae]
MSLGVRAGSAARLLRLDTPRSSAALDLDDGGRLTSLHLGGRELLVPHEGRDPLWWGSFVMAPWTGDLLDGRFTWRDRTWRVPREASGHASHGTVRRSSWTPTAPGRAVAALGEDWPFAGTVELTVELATDALHLRLELRAEEDMPAAIGFHPWFRRYLSPDGAAARVDLPLGTRMLYRHGDGSPSTRFVGLGPPPWNETVRCPVPEVSVVWPGEGTLTLTWTGAFATVFTAHEQGVCVEPVTSPSGRMDDDLAAGDTLGLDLTLTWTPWRPEEDGAA